MIALAVITRVGIKAISINTYKRIIWVLHTLVSYASMYSIQKMDSNNMLMSNTMDFFSTVIIANTNPQQNIL